MHLQASVSPRFDLRYLHTPFNLVADITHLLVPVTLHPHDLVTCLEAQLMQSHRVGPEVSICHSGRQVSLLMHTPQCIPPATGETPL